MASALNFVCIITDQMRGDHMRCAGNPVVATPNLDRLARSGVRFSRAYCNNPLCMPSRATLFTGLTPRGHGVRTNGIPLSRELPTMPGALAQAGYRTHGIGKMHLTPYMLPNDIAPDTLNPVQWPECRHFWDFGALKAVPTPFYGLQSVEITLGHGSGIGGEYLRRLRAVDPAAERLLRPEAGRPARSGAEQAWYSAMPEELHYNTWIADRAIDFISNQPAEEPFFLWCSFPDPHHPYCPPAPWSDLYDPADIPLPTRREGELDDLPPLYRDIFERDIPLSGRIRATRMADDRLREIIALTYGMISHVDHNIGRIIDMLEHRGLRENTVICFLSDHGDMMGDHWLINKGPFHMDGLVRLPCIWSSPMQFPCDRVIESPASWLDFAPTVLDLAGVPIPEGPLPARRECELELPPWPGASLAPVLHGDTVSANESVIVENDEDYLGLRLRTIITERHKLTCYPGHEFGELFDLQEDPGELHNLWNDPAARELRRDLQIQLLERLVATDNRLPRRLTHA